MFTTLNLNINILIKFVSLLLFAWLLFFFFLTNKPKFTSSNSQKIKSVKAYLALFVTHSELSFHLTTFYFNNISKNNIIEILLPSHH